MTTSRIRKTAPHSSSSDSLRTIHLHAPASWAELTQEQLRYVLTLLAQGVEGTKLKTYMFIRFTGITVLRRSKNGWKCTLKKKVFYMQPWQTLYCIDKMKFVDSLEDMCVRLDGIQGFHAVNALLKNVPFKDYLNMDTAYYGYQMSKEETPLLHLAELLYRDKEGKAARGIKPSKAEMLGCLLWFAHVKDVLAKTFTHFFRKRPTDADDGDDYDPRTAIDAQIRALTDGDVTKEQAVYNTDCWRALAELNAKAKEAQEMRMHLKAKK